MSIPPICANCANGDNVGNGQEVIGTVCRHLPFALWKMPQDGCGQFRMDGNPVYAEPDAPGGQGTGGAAPEPTEGKDDAPDGARIDKSEV